MDNNSRNQPKLPPEQIDKVGQWFDVLLYILCFIGFMGWTFVGVREIFIR